MTIPQLGRLFSRIARDVLRSNLNSLLSRWQRELANGKLDSLKIFTIGAYGQAAIAAWTQHARWLASIGALPTRAALLTIAQDGATLANVVEARALALFKTQAMRKPEPYIRLIANLSVRQGWHEGAGLAAEEAEADFKQWVRIFDTKQHRDWHDALEGASLPISQKFRLPGGPNTGRLVEGPHDWNSVPDPREWLNCGHALIYTRQAALGDVVQGLQNRRTRE